MAIQIEPTIYCIDPQIEEFIRESERNRLMEAFACDEKEVFMYRDIVKKICGCADVGDKKGGNSFVA